MAILGPFDVMFPVAFWSEGDTTREAFGKHIQEIKRLYGIINAMDADKVSATELKEKLKEMDDSNSNLASNLQLHIDSTNPHPNWIPVKVINNLTSTSATDALSANQGRMLKAEVDNRVTKADFKEALSSFMEAKTSSNGYVKFDNGIMLQWGLSSTRGIGRATFPVEFPTECLAVVASPCVKDGHTGGHAYGDDGDSTFCLNDWDKSGFGFDARIEDAGYVRVSYIAIGH